MGDEPGQGSVKPIVFFLDENHCGNLNMIVAIEDNGCVCEKHLDHFQRGTDDTEWLPIVAQRGWALVTADARIRWNRLEKAAVRENGARMFYFSSNNSSGSEMGAALRAAIPAMKKLIESQPPPFTASITKSGQVTLRDTFEGE